MAASEGSLPPRSPSARRFPWWIAWAVLVVVVVGAAVISTKFLSISEADADSSASAFDPVSYAAERYESEIVTTIDEDAVPLTDLLTALDAGDDPADFGNTPGVGSSYSFPVTFTGVAGAPNGSILPVTVEGVPAGTTVQVQIGPAINGTALRDVTGTVAFNDFVNQLDFQEVATELNNQAKASVLADIDPTTLEGSTITVTGAFTRVNPALVSVVPVRFEVGP